MRETQTVTIADFLLARITEDEAEARKTVADRQRMYDRGEWVNPEGMNGPDTFLQSWEDHPGPVLIVGAERVLAECEAKRRIVAEHQPWYYPHSPSSAKCTCCAVWDEEDYGGPPTVPWPCPTLRLLALPYADHPDYRQEWKP